MKVSLSLRPGFSLVEVMVVIAIIGILASLITIALTRTETVALSTQCLANERQILNGWLIYAADHEGQFAGPDTNRNPDIDWMKSFGDNLGPGNVELESAIREGSMFPYLGDISIYRSPQDNTTHIRTYSINSFLGEGEGSDWGGPPGWVVGTVARIRHPARLIAVLPENDHRGHNINGWGVDIGGGGVWIDKLATFNPGCINFGYMDGHVETYQWVGESPSVSYDIEHAFNLPQTNVYFPGPDYEFVHRRVFDGRTLEDL
ncbi:MAG: type II secretion system GspH family protein [Phycisphaerales bacterium]|nr:type II secretion system GspH family protein [Phycisphaerales bacterium]